MSCLGDLHNKVAIYVHWQTGTLRGSQAKTHVGHFTLHWLHWLVLVSPPSCVSNEPDTGPYQHSDPGARGNMWPGSQLIRRRTLGSRKMCCRCRHTGTVARPFRSGVWVAVLLHRYASPFKPNVFDLKDRELASKPASIQSIQSGGSTVYVVYACALGSFFFCGVPGASTRLYWLLAVAMELTWGESESLDLFG